MAITQTAKRYGRQMRTGEKVVEVARRQNQLFVEQLHAYLTRRIVRTPQGLAATKLGYAPVETIRPGRSGYAAAARVEPMSTASSSYFIARPRTAASAGGTASPTTR